MTKTSEKIINKILLTRNDTIRNIYGGYARVLGSEGELGPYKYIRKGALFTVISFNLYTRTVLAVNQETKETFSLEYDYLLENCRVLGPLKNKVLDAVAIFNISQPEQPERNYDVLTAILAGLANFFLILLLLS